MPYAAAAGPDALWPLGVDPRSGSTGIANQAPILLTGTAA